MQIFKYILLSISSRELASICSSNNRLIKRTVELYKGDFTGAGIVVDCVGTGGGGVDILLIGGGRVGGTGALDKPGTVVGTGGGGCLAGGGGGADLWLVTTTKPTLLCCCLLGTGGGAGTVGAIAFIVGSFGNGAIGTEGANIFYTYMTFKC
uniref:Uncharacterized protein n=1 Tax=Glossina brevipalpis TaxID=37001 RepID=A0A1A9WVH1_9MUSC